MTGVPPRTTPPTPTPCARQCNAPRRYSLTLVALPAGILCSLVGSPIATVWR